MKRYEIVPKLLRLIGRWILRQFYKIPDYDSRGDNAYYGKFRVVYLDGRESAKMSWRTAKGYAKMFGGKVIDAF